MLALSDPKRLLFAAARLRVSPPPAISGCFWSDVWNFEGTEFLRDSFFIAPFSNARPSRVTWDPYDRSQFQTEGGVLFFNMIRVEDFFIFTRIDFYKDAAKTQLVAQTGLLITDGEKQAVQKNNSSITFSFYWHGPAGVQNTSPLLKLRGTLIPVTPWSDPWAISGDTQGAILGPTLTIQGASNSNTDAGKLYWTLTREGTIIQSNILRLYSDAAKTQLVGQASSITLMLNIVQQNGSGLSGAVQLNFNPADDTDAGNVFTGTANVGYIAPWSINGPGSAKVTFAHITEGTKENTSGGAIFYELTDLGGGVQRIELFLDAFKGTRIASVQSGVTGSRRTLVKDPGGVSGQVIFAAGAPITTASIFNTLVGTECVP
jgi:hypothetical protein